MKAKEIVLIVVIGFALFIAKLALFPTPIRFDIALSGTPGTRVEGTHECGGVVTPFSVVVPATISCEAKRDFKFRASKLDVGATIHAALTSDVITGQSEARPG